MRGLFKRKGSKIWQGRFRIPEDLWKRRAELVALGVHELGKSQEFAQSLGSEQQDAAAATYRDKLTAWDAKLAVWQAMLDGGPVTLTHMNTQALAAEYAVSILDKHRSDPQLAKAPMALKIILENVAGHSLYVDHRQDLHDALRAVVKELDGLSLTDVLAALPQMHSAEPAGPRKEALRWALDALAVWRRQKGWALAPAAAQRKGIAITKDSHRKLADRMATMEGRAWERLVKYVEGDYGKDPWEANRPAFVPQATSPGRRSGPTGILTLFDLLDSKAKVQSIKAKTLSDDRAYLTKFSDFVGHSDARKVTKEEVRRWRDHLIDSGTLSPKTINDKYLSALRAALAHGVTEYDLPTNAASGVRDKRKGTGPVSAKGYTEEQALSILAATFKGSNKSLSLPHRRAIFWVPWILAYTGLRVTEVTQLQGRNVRDEDGTPLIFITPKDGSTKSGKAWAVGVHKHLIALGLLDMFRAVGDGPAFYNPYPADTDLAALGSKHRAKDSGNRVSGWITDEVGIAAPIGRPNHAWRHLFTTRARRPDVAMNKEARDFMMGSGRNDAREGYGEWPPAALEAEINKLPRFNVADTGWRPE